MNGQPPLDEFTCRQAWIRLYEYLDRELDTGEEMAVRRHLAICGECLKHFIFEERLLGQIREKCRNVRAPEGLRQQIEELVSRL